jgi:hypothetical protein
MDWGDLTHVLKWLLGGWLLLVMGLILFNMITGRIILIGILRLEKTAPFGFDRLQLLAVTLFFAAGYAVAALVKGGDSLPSISTPLLLILIGSHGTYLAVKLASLRGGPGRGS